MGFLYLASLLAALACFALLDRRFGLYLWRSPGPAVVVLLAGLAFFLAWDGAAIRLGIFFRGETPYMTGVTLGPELPLEEPVFLLFLCYVTMILFTGASRLLASSRRGRDGAAGHDGAGRDGARRGDVGGGRP